MKLLKFAIDFFIGVMTSLMVLYVSVMLVHTLVFTPTYFKELAIENFETSEHFDDGEQIDVFRIESDGYYSQIYLELRPDNKYLLVAYCNRQSTFNQLFLNDFFDDRFLEVDIEFVESPKEENLEDYKILYLTSQYILSHD